MKAMVDKDPSRGAIGPLAVAAEDKRGRETRAATAVGGLRDIQGQYEVLTDILEKQKSYGQRVSDMLGSLQMEADTIVKIPPEALGPPCTAAYLVSDAVVIMFDLYRNMTSKPLRSLPTEAIVSVVDACTPELKKMIAEKRFSESSKVSSLERVMKDLEAAQAEVNLARRESGHAAPAQAHHAEARSEAPEQPVAPPKGDGGETNKVDEVVLEAVEKSLDVLGHDGRQVVLKLLEERYGLKLEDIPQHPRAFVELLDGLVGNGSRVIEKEIINEISKEGQGEGKALYEVVDSMREPEGAHVQEPVETPAESTVEDVHEVAAPEGASLPTMEPEPAPPEPQASIEQPAQAAETQQPAQDGFKFDFKISAKPIPIAEFLQS